MKLVAAPALCNCRQAGQPSSRAGAAQGLQGARALPFMPAMPMKNEDLWIANLQLSLQLCGVIQEAGQKVQRRRSKLHEGPLLKVPVLHELSETVDL